VDPDRVIPAIARSLKLCFSGREDSSIELLNFLRGRSILLVMDNFEHIQEASCILSDILRSTRNVKILVTSRSLLHLSGEHMYMIEGLEFPPHAEGTQLSEYSSIELFDSGRDSQEPGTAFLGNPGHLREASQYSNSV
jgi:non-specific serine/threonine protein kinase